MARSRGEISWRGLVARSRGEISWRDLVAGSWRGERAVLAGRAGLHRETGQARGGRRIRARPSLLPSSAAQGRSRGHACPRTAGRRSGGIACPLWPSSEALGEMPRRSGGVRTCAPEGHAIGAAWRPWRRSHLRCGGVVIEFALNMLYEKVSTRGRVAESGSGHTRFAAIFGGACEGGVRRRGYVVCSL